VAQLLETVHLTLVKITSFIQYYKAYCIICQLYDTINVYYEILLIYYVYYGNIFMVTIAYA